MLLKLNSKGEEVKKLQMALKIEADGIFGKKTETAVKAFQKKNKLTVDGIVGEKTWKILFPETSSNTETKTTINDKVVDPSVTYNPINVHISKKLNREIKYLVIHFTAGSTSKKGAAEGCRRVFLNRQASADFAVDDATMLQINPDLKNYYTWAVGDGKGKCGITNSNSISIEICSNLKKGVPAKYSNHDGWYFTDDALDNALKLSKILMKKYNIPVERVIRHYDASGKLCPGILGWNTGFIYDPITGKNTGKKNTDEKWKEFKEKLS